MARSGAIGSFKDHKSAVERLVAKNAQQATRYLSEYFGKRAWIAEARVKKAKR
jgi:hypothetical protein